MFAEVVLNLPLDRAFTYRVPEGMSVAPGVRVRVPFGKRRLRHLFDIFRLALIEALIHQGVVNHGWLRRAATDSR